MPSNNPLKDDHYALCCKVERDMADLQQELERMARCDHDCSDLEMKRQYLLDKARRYKTEYWPERS